MGLEFHIDPVSGKRIISKQAPSQFAMSPFPTAGEAAAIYDWSDLPSLNNDFANA
jgi:hypothetical protein